MPQTLSQRRALRDINRRLHRAPTPPIYAGEFVVKARWFFIALLAGIAILLAAGFVAAFCITFGI